jgi:hypothetical protein
MERAARRARLYVSLAAWFLYSASALGPKEEVQNEWIDELWSVPQPTHDASGKYKSFSKDFVRNDPATGEYTHLSYSSTFAVDHFVNLDDFPVTNVTCIDNTINIQTSTLEGMELLERALRACPSGLLFGGLEWRCSSIRGEKSGPIYRCECALGPFLEGCSLAGHRSFTVRRAVLSRTRMFPQVTG